MSPKSNSRPSIFSMIFRAILVAGVATLLILPPPGVVKAASTYTVNSLADTYDGICDAADCTLRDAIGAANDDPGSTIDFTVTGTITLSSNLTILQPVTIDGPGADQLTVSGNNLVRPFWVENPETVATISGLTISDGMGDPGGGIYILNSSLTLSNCILANNTSTGVGGGIFIEYSEGGVRLVDSTVSGNSAHAAGGGIYAQAGDVLITNSTIAGNSAGTGGGGGGIFSSANTLITHSTVSGNSSVGIGGGIEAEGNFTLQNSTVAGNSSSIGGGIAFNTGGSGLFEISNSTLSGNSAPVGSGVFGNNNTVESQSRLLSSIIALNSGGGDDVVINGPTLTASLGYNVIGTSTGTIWTPTDQTGVTAAQLKLGPLANNGGPTETMALLSGSGAIDQGLNASADTFDQRGSGFIRTIDDPDTANANGGDGTDVGAFEIQATGLPLSELGPTNVWIGLKNSDDVGIKFDLRAEAYRGTELVGSGELTSVLGGSSGFNNARQHSVPMTPVPGSVFAPGETLNFKLLVRNACSGSGKNSGRARLWFNDAAANSRFDATIGNSATYFLRSGSALTTLTGSGPKQTIDIQAGAKCSVYKTFDTWSITLP